MMLQIVIVVVVVGRCTSFSGRAISRTHVHHDRRGRGGGGGGGVGGGIANSAGCGHDNATTSSTSATGRAATVKQVSSHLVLQYEDFLHFLRTIRFGYTEHRLFSLDVGLPRGVVDDLVLDHLGRVTL